MHSQYTPQVPSDIILQHFLYPSIILSQIICLFTVYHKMALTSCLHQLKRQKTLQYYTRCLLSSNTSTRSIPSNQGCENYDITVVGGGIVGVATAREILLRNPKLKMAIVEKEDDIALHQSSHNSGVIHAGIYYAPGSLKAKLCGEGLKLLYAYCDANKVPYKKVGKIIVATTPDEVSRLKLIEERARKNNVPDLQLLNNQDEIKKVEPYCRGLKALWSPHTGIIDYKHVTHCFASDFKKAGGLIYLNFEVNDFKLNDEVEYPVKLISKTQNINSKYVLTCGGLHSDVLAAKSNCSKEPQIIPFRGEYLKLNEDKNFMIKGNIYPVPDPRFPFLGVHFTPRMDGSVLLGPNAVLGLRREGYSWTSLKLSEFVETVSYPGFRKMAFKYVIPGFKEAVKSVFTSIQMKDLQRYIPEITAKDVTRGMAGVRAQAMTINGDLVDDFVFSRGCGVVGERVLHCRNAPSPACTSSLAIAKMLADKVKDEFKF